MASSSSLSLRTTMRIIALPLTTSARIPSAAAASTALKSRLTYYNFQTPEQAVQPTTLEPATAGWLPDGGRLASWATAKAGSVWSDFGKAEGGWKLKAYQTGQGLMDKTEFEELALRSFDPPMGPSISDIKRRSLLDSDKIPLIYPPSLFPSSPSSVLSELQAHVASRIVSHRRGFYLWSAAIPPTVPLKLIPVIPNFPFFFSAWRAWSHYKAKTSAESLQSLLEHDMVVPAASAELDEIYLQRQIPDSSDPDITRTTNPSLDHNSESESDAPPSQSQQLIITHEDIPTLVSFFSRHSMADPTAAAAAAEVDLKRAIEQARDRVNDGSLS